MTDDPKRWLDDEGAPDAMREFLRDARLDAPTLDEATRRRVRERLARPATTSSRVLVIALAALAVAVLLFVLWPSSTTPPPIAVDPERDGDVADGGLLDAAAAREVIRIERTCGEEDVGYACVVHVETTRPYGRLEIHGVYGIAPPSCDGPRVGTEWIERTSDTSLTLESGQSYDPQLALRACAYDADVLVATGTLEGTRRVPRLDVYGFEDAAGLPSYDLRVQLADNIVDPDAMAFAIVQQAHEDESDEGYPASCAGDVVAEISRGLALAFDEDERVALPIHVDGVPSRSVTFVVCARDASGTLTTQRPGQPSYPTPIEPHVPVVLTPSGEIPIDMLRVGHRVLSRVHELELARTMPNQDRWRLDVVDRIDARADWRLHRIRLQDGHSATLPSFVRVWSAERHAFVALDDLHAGEHVVDEREVDVEVALVTALPEDEHAWYDEPVLADPASYFLDGILVGGRHARQRALAPSPPPLPPSPSPLEVWPARADDCAIRATLEVGVEALRARGVNTIAVVFAPQRDGAGTREDVDCATARVSFEASLTDLATIPVDVDGGRRLSIDMPAFSDLTGGESESQIECDTGYAVMACVRDASGLHALADAQGRWAMSGSSCFADSTLVATADGPRAIASLRRGEAIEAYDAEAGRSVMARVDRLISRGDRPILALALSNGAVLRVTAEHPLFDARSGSFRDAGTFAIGDALRGPDGTDVLIVDVHHAGRAHVYDLSVTGPHTFFAEGIVAHNY